MPTPNMGLQANGMAMVKVATEILTRALPMLGVGTEQGKDVMKALNGLSKHLQQGGGSPGIENNALAQLMMQRKREQPQIDLLRNQSAQSPTPAPGAGASPPPTQQAA